MNHRSAAWLLGLLVLFVLLRLPGLDTPYQQDEFKDVVAAEAGLAQANAYFTHPPLTALLFWGSTYVFGGEHMRLLPLFFGITSALLLFMVVSRRFDDRTALVSLAVYTVAFSPVWASLQIGTDGAVLPALFLATVYFYDRAREGGVSRFWWLTGVALVLLTGLMVKLSFIIVVGALVLDLVYAKRHNFRIQHLKYGGLASVGFAGVCSALFFALRALYPSFHFEGVMQHALAYMHLSGRNYLQIVIQSIKTVYYLSPLLLVPLLFLSREMLERARIFTVYLFFGLIFYILLFDFSRGALDKYLLFLAAPLSVLAGAALTPLLRRPRFALIVGAVGLAVLLALLNALPHTAVPLYPKTEWFSRVLQGEWNILTPLNGGSGPLGFYGSFLFIAASFGVAVFFAGIGLVRSELRPMMAVLIISVGLTYNVVFIEEFMVGGIYGSAPTVLRDVVLFIETMPATTRIVSYNHIGAYEFEKQGKYATRFYAAPQFEAGQKVSFAKHSAEGGIFVVVGIPPLYEGFYTEFLKGCTVLFTTRSNKIEGTVYNACRTTL